MRAAQCAPIDNRRRPLAFAPVILLDARCKLKVNLQPEDVTNSGKPTAWPEACAQQINQGLLGQGRTKLRVYIREVQNGAVRLDTEDTTQMPFQLWGSI